MTTVCVSMTMLPSIKQSVRERFVDNKVPEMDCPAQSSDLNPNANFAPDPNALHH
jgi:hypothetical protein